MTVSSEVVKVSSTAEDAPDAPQAFIAPSEPRPA